MAAVASELEQLKIVLKTDPGITDRSFDISYFQMMN